MILLTISTLSRANENRDWIIYQNLAQLLIGKARKFYANDNDFKIELQGAVYALDSTVIELCLTTFKRAYFELGKSAVKIHTQLDLRGNIPSFFLITEAKTHDVNFLDVFRRQSRKRNRILNEIFTKFYKFYQYPNLRKPR